MPVSEKQRVANQQNAQHATGPKPTPANPPVPKTPPTRWLHRPHLLDGEDQAASTSSDAATSPPSPQNLPELLLADRIVSLAATSTTPPTRGRPLPGRPQPPPTPRRRNPRCLPSRLRVPRMPPALASPTPTEPPPPTATTPTTLTRAEERLQGMMSRATANSTRYKDNARKIPPTCPSSRGEVHPEGEAETPKNPKRALQNVPQCTKAHHPPKNCKRTHFKSPPGRPSNSPITRRPNHLPTSRRDHFPRH